MLTTSTSTTIISKLCRLPRVAALTFVLLQGLNPVLSVRLLVAQDPFAEGVRTTEALTPAQEQASFSVPPGFRIDLVASEPQIFKPMNLAFDVRGRIWITDSLEYPYAAPADRVGRDSVKILEDQDGDGSFETVTTFADGLNIPIGIYPTLDGCIVYSIPYIWHLQDLDGDNRADRRTILYGPMGFERDTHGMNNSFTRGYDGWLYACHGFNNETKVAGRDGHQIHMQSGNTYRMRMDGERVEQFTWGQVNPFGMTIDRLGNLFTADCHSKPVYQLVRGGYYPSFGKPHDGLGFVPPIMEHLHGSTAIAGVAILDDARLPEEFRGQLISGNVMTSRINRNRLDVKGATRAAIEQPDFVSTTDPWFRPVDVRLGPDGSIYVCDFYNRIIGHYEVPLTHPGRDRERGRIWRISYVGNDANAKPNRLPKLADDSDEQLIARFTTGNLTERLLALNLLVDRADDEFAASTLETLSQLVGDPSASDDARAVAAWALYRSGTPIEQIIASVASESSDSQTAASTALQVHLARMISEAALQKNEVRQFITSALHSTDPDVQAAAADAVANSARRIGYGIGVDQAADSASLLPQMLLALQECDEQDVMLRQGLRIGIKEMLKVWPAETPLAWDDLSVEARRDLTEVALAVQSAQAAALVHRGLSEFDLGSNQADAWRHVATWGEPELLTQVAQEIPERFSGNLPLQFELLVAVHRGMRERGLDPQATLQDWGTRLSRELLDDAGTRSSWTNYQIAGAQRQDNPWTLEQRMSADGTQEPFLTTLASGEPSVGRLRSPKFVVGDSFSFWSAGHCGFPDEPFAPKNFLRLIDLSTGATLIETTPPRNDTAQQITWKTSEFAGREVAFEVLDADEAGAYAWVSVGRFDAPVLLPDVAPRAASERVQQASLLIRELRLLSLRDPLVNQIQSGQLEPGVRLAAVEACLSVQPDSLLQLIAPWVGTDRVGAAWQAQTLQRLAQGPLSDREAESDLRRQLLDQLVGAFDAREQDQLAERGAASNEGLAQLVDLWERGRLSTRPLSNRQFTARVLAIADQATQAKIEAWQAALPLVDELIASTLAERRGAFVTQGGSIERGQPLFTKHCAACHQIAGTGAVVGPQLDGIGLRGLERLSEDLLDPNRNVDVAFRPTIVETDDGATLAGLVREENDSTMVLVDSLGKEIVIDISSIVAREPSTLSLMPETLGRDMPEQDFLDLLAYLLSQKELREP